MEAYGQIKNTPTGLLQRLDVELVLASPFSWCGVPGVVSRQPYYVHRVSIVCFFM